MFRTHLGRRIDPSLTASRLILAMTAAMGVAGVAIWLTGDATGAWLAPVHTFLVWALVRELDPDSHWTALVGGLVAGVWVLLGLEIVGALAVAGLLISGRLVLNPVGLRPLNTDLAAIAVLATVISFSAVGWVAGSGIALAIYIDARMANEAGRAALFAAIAAALGSSVVATAANALPRTLPSVDPLIVLLVGLLALTIVVRDPIPLQSPVDADDTRLMSTARLHAARVLTVVLVFVAVILSGQEAIRLGPILIALALVLGSEELQRFRRPAP